MLNIEKNINSLIVDVQHLLTKKDGWFNPELSKEFADEITKRLDGQFNQAERAPKLRLSKVGLSCPKALWYSIKHPELAEPLPPWATFKYSFGHILEALAISFAKAAGHEVAGEQDELVLDGIVGHRDCVIDGYIVDVKSASTNSFKTFENRSFTDLFGYLDQLDAYTIASREDPLVKHKDVAYDWVIDKQLGHMCLYKHHVTAERESALRDRIARYKRIVASDTPPACECQTISDETFGNIRLDTRASYSPYKYICFPHLRTFLLGKGPLYLTQVKKRPYNKFGPVPEVDKHGNPI